MPELGFHFNAPVWLWLLLVPLIVLLWLRLSTPRFDSERYRDYADARLLPLLLGVSRQSRGGKRRGFLFWALVWALLVVTLAGPRWGYHDVQLFRPGSDLVILVDLSRSMDIEDVAPSRLGRARQEIEDLIGRNRQTRLGMIAFATLAHVVSPLTEDGNTLRLQLPALSSDLVQLKGSRLSEALVRARQMLAGQPADSSRHLLLISDGDFADTRWEVGVRQLAAEGIRVHVLGVGTNAGRTLILPDGQRVRSRLEEDVLKRVARLGEGLYQKADYRDSDILNILQRVAQDTSAQLVANQHTRIWHERFFWLLGPAMLLLLPWFRRTRREPGVPAP